MAVAAAAFERFLDACIRGRQSKPADWLQQRRRRNVEFPRCMHTWASVEACRLAPTTAEEKRRINLPPDAYTVFSPA
jgi:hypothetical protein